MGERSLLSVAAFLLVTACFSNSGNASASGTPVQEMPNASLTTAKAGELRPTIVSWPDLEKFYPEDAEARGVEGIVRIAVTLDEKGRATDTKVLSVTPAGFGFSSAASTAVHFMTFSNPTGHRVMIKFALKFALSHAKPRHHHVRRR